MALSIFKITFYESDWRYGTERNDLNSAEFSKERGRKLAFFVKEKNWQKVDTIMNFYIQFLHRILKLVRNCLSIEFFLQFYQSWSCFQTYSKPLCWKGGTSLLFSWWFHHRFLNSLPSQFCKQKSRKISSLSKKLNKTKSKFYLKIIQKENCHKNIAWVFLSWTICSECKRA